MPKLVVTTMKSGIRIVDTVTKSITPILSVGAAIGICRVDDYFVLAERGGQIHVLNMDLEPIGHFASFNDFVNLHDVVAIGEQVLIVDSNRNRLLIYDKQSRDSVDQIFFSTSLDNIHHINCMKFHEGYLYLSLFMLDINRLAVKHALDVTTSHSFKYHFGQGMDKFPYPTGAIIKFNLATRTIEDLVVQRLWQPHSICFIGNDLHYVESARGKLFNGTEELFMCDAYLRGLTYDDSNIYVGKSTHRRQESSPAGIIVLDRNTYAQIDEIELEGVSEVYDIIVL